MMTDTKWQDIFQIGHLGMTVTGIMYDRNSLRLFFFVLSWMYFFINQLKEM